MIRSATFLSLLFLLAAADAPPAASPDKQLAAAAKEAAAIRKTFDDELTVAKHDMPLVVAANDKYRKAAAEWAKRATELVLAHPAEPAALDVILEIEKLRSID